MAGYQTAIIMFKAKNHELPANIQSLFHDSKLHFKTVKINTTTKSFCVSIIGVTLWNKLNDEHKRSTSIARFKSTYKNMIFTRYRKEERDLL